MKKILFTIAALAVAFGFIACSNEDEVLENGKNGKLIVTAFTESGITRTALDGNDEKGYDVVWEKGDKFFIYKVTQQGTDYKTHLPRYMFNRVDGPFNLISEAGTTNGTFEKEGDALPNYEGYVALYPDFPESFEWVMLDDFYPTEQTYSEGNIKGFPMRASFNVENGKIKGSISFQNMNGILRLTVKGTATVKSIKVSAEELSTPITLDCGDGVALTSEGKVFHIAMLDNTYTGVKITLTETDGNTCTKTFKGTDGLKIERSKITTAAFAVSFPTTGTAKRTGDIDVNWVQLWEGGPKFAEYNVGATSSTEYGGYYHWGKSTDQDSNGNYKGGTELLTGADDTATALWGDKWRMPTKAEFELLIKKCSYKKECIKDVNGNDVNGFLFKGKDTYAENSIFLPAAGYYSSNSKKLFDQNSIMYYWSSTPDNSNSYGFAGYNDGSIFDGTVETCSYGRNYYGYSVRAVLK